MKLRTSHLLLFVPLLCLPGCGGDKSAADKAVITVEPAPGAPVDPMQDKGVGPIKSVTLGSLDEAMAAKGMEIYALKCSACHKVDKRFVGPAPMGIFERRTPEWIMNMILNPEKMVAENAQARALLAEYLAPMANQNLTEEEARAVLEYFRTLDTPSESTTTNTTASTTP